MFVSSMAHLRGDCVIFPVFRLPSFLRMASMRNLFPIRLKLEPWAVLMIVAVRALLAGNEGRPQSRSIDVCLRRTVAALATHRHACGASGQRLKPSRLPVA